MKRLFVFGTIGGFLSLLVVAGVQQYDLNQVPVEGFSEAELASALKMETLLGAATAANDFADHFGDQLKEVSLIQLKQYAQATAAAAKPLFEDFCNNGDRLPTRPQADRIFKTYHTAYADKLELLADAFADQLDAKGLEGCRQHIANVRALITAHKN